jgi:hypothetical protein
MRAMTTTSYSQTALAQLRSNQSGTLFTYPKYWAECYGPAPYLPMSRKEMDALGWDSCDIIIVTGDAYVDHPSFGMAVIGRFLEVASKPPCAASRSTTTGATRSAAAC